MSTQSWSSTDPVRFSLSELIWVLAKGITLQLCLSNPVIAGATVIFLGAFGFMSVKQHPGVVTAKSSMHIIGWCIPAIARGIYNYFWTSSLTTIPSPLDTYLPGKADRTLSGLPYPPNALPGARDVDTPHGKVRAYEWGPEDGRKVLLVHGISTPCISLARLAEDLVQKGCRVILFGMPAQ